MSACKNRQVAQLLHAYELGLLNDVDRERVELHVLECDTCFQELLRMESTSQLLRDNSEVKETVAEIVREDRNGVAVRSEHRTYWRIIAPVAVTAAIVLALVLKDWRLEIKPEEPVIAVENRVAILPFENLTPDAKNSDMGDVIANLMITGMSQAPSLQIVSSQYIYDLSRQIDRSEAVSRENSVAAVAKKARARWLLDGAITQVASEMVVTAQLIDVTAGTVKKASRVSINNERSVFAATDQLASELNLALIQPSVIAKELYHPVAEMTTSSPEAYQEYIRGLDLYRKFFRPEAATHFRQAAKLDSTFAMPCYYLSLIALGPEAQEWLKRALAHVDRAGNRDRYFIKSRAAALSGDWKANLDVLNAFVTRYPDEKEPLIQLGIAESFYGMLEQAKSHYLAALALDSSNGLAWNQIAYTYQQLGAFDSAMSAIDRYIALSPNEPNPYDSRAEICGRAGYLKRAMESSRLALKVKPDFNSSLIFLGITAIYSEDYHLADSCFHVFRNSTIASDRRTAELYRCFIPAYQGRFREALKRLDSTFQADNSVEAAVYLPYRLFWKATVLDAAGDQTQALRILEKSIQLAIDADRSDSIRRKAYHIRLLAQMGRLEEARAAARQLKVQLEEGNYYMLPYAEGMADIYLAADHPDSALAIFEPHLHESDAFIDRLLLGRVYLANHRLDDAAAMLKRSSSTYTAARMFWTAENVKAYYYAGIAFEQLGELKFAADQYRTFLRIWSNADPGVKEIDDARARLKRLEPGRSGS